MLSLGSVRACIPVLVPEDYHKISTSTCIISVNSKRNKTHHPRPSPRVRIPLDENSLGSGARGTDAIDGGLVEGGNERVVHVMVLIVGVEDHVPLGLEVLLLVSRSISMYLREETC
jgi:hypothetical protein